LVPAAVPDSADASPRAGLVVSRAVGGSVVRHRVARRLRHLLASRLATLSPWFPAGGSGATGGGGGTVLVLGDDLDSVCGRSCRTGDGRERRRRRSVPAHPAARPLVVLVRGYQRWISPALPPTCRFHPTCSAYAVEALQVHGLVKGTALTVWRPLRCAPWHPGGVDEVPPRAPPYSSSDGSRAAPDPPG
jgi:putative membrane protein insertion efficiency factor